MDNNHRFHTPSTWLLVRLEHIVLLVAITVVLFLRRTEVSWPSFVAAFVLIDLIGYMPGAIAYRRHRGNRVAPIYHHLYNITHSYLTGAVIVGVWALAMNSFEWAMLAVPLHLSGDRGLFGNTYKPVDLPFEPEESMEGRDASQKRLQHQTFTEESLTEASR